MSESSVGKDGARHKVAGLSDPLAALRGPRAQLFPWVPVCLAAGIGLYFRLAEEPGGALLAAAAATVLLAVVLRVFAPEAWHAPAVACGLVAAGLLLVTLRANLVAAPVLPFRYYGPVTGRVVDIDRSFSDALRITLDRVALDDVDPEVTPDRVRIALHGDPPGVTPLPGMTVMLTAHLDAPDGPVAPGGFDFQRIAWFARLGGIGYSRAPLMTLAPPRTDSPGMLAFRARMWLSQAMQARMEGQAGALASAFMTGDRSGVSAETNEIMRASNLSHMISISGLHMGLVVGFVFALVRYGLALVPPAALRMNSKKVAAVFALAAATAYLALAGPDVATRRSWIMAAVMLLAVLADRRAVSMRTLAVAALIVLGLEPESLLNPGFQMSFGATAAIIAIIQPWQGVQDRVPALLRPVALLVITSLAAGVATGPIAAAHFNRVAAYGLVANFLAVPVMGVVVMPAGVLSGILAPVGLAGPALWLMEQGTRAVLVIAAWVAGFGGAVSMVPSPAPAVLPVLGLGGAIALFAAGRLRLAGAALIAASLLLWSAVPRPAVLIAGDGGLVGVMADKGRAMSRARGSGFVAKNWLEDDGDPADQETAFARAAFSGGRGRAEGRWGVWRIVHLTGKTAPARAAADCAAGTILVIGQAWTGTGPCVIFDAARLLDTGAVALSESGGALTVVTARSVTGNRIWNRPRDWRGRNRDMPTDSAPVAVAERGAGGQ